MIYQDKDGNRVETIDGKVSIQRPGPRDLRVYFCNQGGGFQCSLPFDVFHATFKPAPEPTWREGTVTAEWFDDGRSYPCWSNGDRWNGWGMPYFTKATIDSMLTDLNSAGLSELVHWVDGKLLVTDPQEDDTYEVKPITVGGCAEPLYGLGAGSWTWDAVEFKS